MGKQKHRNESREVINYHRLGNIGQLVIKMNEQLDFIQALCLMSDEEKAAIRKDMEEQDGLQQDSGAGEQDREIGDSDGSSVE